MYRFAIYSLISVCIALAMTGCNTIADARSGRGSGDIRTYPFAFEKVWSASVDAVASSNLDLVSSNKAEGEILAQKGISFASWGENVALWVEPIGGIERFNGRSSRVEIVSKRAVSTNITARDWAVVLHERIAAALARDSRE